jgi:succinate dehydrogenase / fumarate reductase flavoprotein subunit
MPGVEADDPAERKRLATAWCERFVENNKKFLKSSVARLDEDGEPQITYEDVDTSLIPPRPRLYGLVGGEVIEEVWQEKFKEPAANQNGNGSSTAAPKATTTS